MALLTPSPSGGDVTYLAAAGGGDTFANHGNERLHFKNGSGGDITVHVAHQTPCNQGVIHGAVDYIVPAGLGLLLPALPVQLFNDSGASPGFVHLTYSAVTTLTVAVLAG